MDGGPGDSILNRRRVRNWGFERNNAWICLKKRHMGSIWQQFSWEKVVEYKIKVIWGWFEIFENTSKRNMPKICPKSLYLLLKTGTASFNFFLLHYLGNIICFVVQKLKVVSYLKVQLTILSNVLYCALIIDNKNKSCWFYIYMWALYGKYFL